ncbi:MAG: L-fucose:H+ symporter permease [Bacteroidota bacterium]|nr:L-fucose:H+ symporter permease [Bacteroidota bacterium]
MASKEKKSLVRVNGKNYIMPFILLTSLFLMWGLANNMTDTLLAAFKKIMSMTDFQTSWIQLAFYGSYFCLALPAAIFIKKFTYKSGVLLGLGMFILGSLLFYPASNTQIYGHFLVALFILAGGLSVLETASNSYVIFLGPPETATRRLNLAQSFNPIGSILGVVLSKFFILSNLNHAGASERSGMTAEELTAIQTDELNAVMGPYVGIAVILVIIWLLIAYSKMPKALDDEGAKFGATFKRLFRNPNYIWGVVAQFFYVGAQIGVWSFTIRYVMKELNLYEEQASTYYIAALVAFTLSRFVFTGLMKYFKPGTLLSVSAILAIISTSVVIFGSGMLAVIALVAISAFMSLMFPTIFGQAVQGLGNDTKIAGSGLIMAILGGAVLTAIQGLVSDRTGNIHYSYLVPLVCFIVIAFYGYYSNRFKTT